MCLFRRLSRSCCNVVLTVVFMAAVQRHAFLRLHIVNHKNRWFVFVESDAS